MATATALPTRDQLDEIDALLRRMLTLPPLGTEAEPSPPPSVYSAPSIREVPPASPPAVGDPVVQSWRVEWPPASPSVVNWGAPAPAAPEPVTFAAPVVPPYALAVPFVPAAEVVPGVTFVEQPPPSTMQQPVPSYLWPAIALNGVFDIVTYFLGPIGSLLRGPGRPVLGWLGILMVVAASLWAAGEWAGYEWPKVDVSKWTK